MQVKMGYINAYDYLEHFIKKYDNDRDRGIHAELLDVLNDFQYCVLETEKMSKVNEIISLFKQIK